MTGYPRLRSRSEPLRHLPRRNLKKLCCAAVVGARNGYGRLRLLTWHVVLDMSQTNPPSKSRYSSVLRTSTPCLLSSWATPLRANTSSHSPQPDAALSRWYGICGVFITQEIVPVGRPQSTAKRKDRPPICQVRSLSRYLASFCSLSCHSSLIKWAITSTHEPFESGSRRYGSLNQLQKKNITQRCNCEDTSGALCDGRNV